MSCGRGAGEGAAAVEEVAGARHHRARHRRPPEVDQVVQEALGMWNLFFDLMLGGRNFIFNSRSGSSRGSGTGTGSSRYDYPCSLKSGNSPFLKPCDNRSDLFTLAGCSAVAIARSTAHQRQIY